MRLAMRFKFRLDRRQRAWCLATSIGIAICASSNVFAQEPPRHLPLPIEVVAVTDKPESFATDYTAAPTDYTTAPMDHGSATHATLIAAETPIDNRASEISLATHADALPLSPETGPLRIGQLRSTGETTSPHARPLRTGTGLSKVVASLAVVLGLLFGFVWASRRLGTSRSRGLPDEVVQVLGQFPLGGRQQATVVRFGSKLLALSITPGGVETIGELDDHLEVESLTQLCLGSDTGAVPGRVRDAVDRYAAARGM